MTKFSALIERLQAAPGPDRAIDADIFRAIGLTEAQERHCKDWCRMDGRTDLTTDRYIAAWAPAFTRSVDDALTLLPPGLWWLLGAGKARPDEPLYGAQIRDPGRALEDPPIAEAEHPTSPAIALSIAALRSREED